MLGWCAELFFTEGPVFAKGDFLVSAHALDQTFVFLVVGKPDFMVRVVISQGLKKGRGAVVVEVGCAYIVCHWISGFSEKRRVDYLINAQLCEGALEVGEGNSPFFLLNRRRIGKRRPCGPGSLCRTNHCGRR